MDSAKTAARMVREATTPRLDAAPRSMRTAHGATMANLDFAWELVRARSDVELCCWVVILVWWRG